jgi:5'-nucleotidase
LSSFESSELKKLILHINDVHSHIDPFLPTTLEIHGRCGEKSFTIETIRKEDPNVLLLDAVIFSGDSLLYYGGELEFKLMSMMHDASTIENHDFDNGVEGLYAQMPHAKFVLSANYDLKNTIEG